jgi:hypothetical protein
MKKIIKRMIDKLVFNRSQFTSLVKRIDCLEEYIKSFESYMGDISENMLMLKNSIPSSLPPQLKENHVTYEQAHEKLASIVPIAYEKWYELFKENECTYNTTYTGNCSFENNNF